MESIDVLDGKTLNIDCLDKGFVRLVDCMPRLSPRGTCDFAVVQAARVSYGEGTKTVNEDEGLIRYLMRHSHTTPFEMAELKFHCKMPGFVSKQWVRHRTANINEYSGRYSIIKDEYYLPANDNVRAQSKNNKQGGNTQYEDAEGFLNNLKTFCDDAYSTYTKFVENGVAKEQARMILPNNFYTEWYWKIDLHNLLHFLALRCDSHAQQEIRVFADAILELITPVFPITIQAWEDYHPMRGAMKLTRLEVDRLRAILGASQVGCPEGLEFTNKREESEFCDKLSNLLGYDLYS